MFFQLAAQQKNFETAISVGLVLVKLFLRGGQKVERIIRDDPALRKHARRFAVGQHDLDRLAGSIQENTMLFDSATRLAPNHDKALIAAALPAISALMARNFDPDSIQH